MFISPFKIFNIVTISEIASAITIIAGIPAPTHIIITGPNATFGSAFSITKNGSDTLEMNDDHHRIIAIITPIMVPKENPTNVSIHVILRCLPRSFDDKFRNVFTILDGWLVIKLSIFPSLARSSHIPIKATTIKICVASISIFLNFFFLKYLFLSSDISFFSSFFVILFKLLPHYVKILTKFRLFSTI